jgi:hypothetical protein
VHGVRPGEHASQPPMRGETIEERIPQEQLQDYDGLAMRPETTIHSLDTA